ERGTLAKRRPLTRRPRRAVDGAHVLPVDLHRREPKAGRPPRDRVVERGRPADERLYGVLVVLAERNQRQLLDGGEVDRLPRPPGVGPALAEEPEADLAAPAELRGQRRTHRDAERRADDAVRPVVAQLKVIQM